jgi:hypothetical protein
MRRMLWWQRTAATVAALFWACGGAQKTGGGGSGAGEVPWPEKNRSQRMQYMREVVAPEMNKVFVAYDTEHFRDFGCPTCHGENMQKVGFKMPNDLPALASEGTLEKARAHDAKMTDFMQQEVVPKMAELLQSKPGPASGSAAFDCFDCHPRQ